MALCKDEFNFTWVIENYLFCAARNGDFLTSSAFSTKARNAQKWYINIFPKGDHKDTEEYVSLHVRSMKTDLEKKKMDLNVKLCIADSKGIVALEERKGIFNKHGYYEFPKVLETKALEQKMRKLLKDTLVVQCSVISEKDPDVENATKISEIAKTTIDFDKFSFNWKVDFNNSSNVLVKKYITDMNGSQFEIVVKAPQEDVLIEIKRIENPDDQDHKVKCEIFFLKDYNFEILFTDDFFFFDRLSHEIWNFPPFLKRSDLVDENFGESCYLKFNIYISNDMSVEKYIDEKEYVLYRPLSEVSKISPTDLLLDDLHSMLFNEKFSDVKLQVDKEVICAHKLFLASRSPVFSAMFDQDMIENQTGTIEISDMTADTLRLFLKFLYTGILDDLDSETMLELLLASEKYQVPSLREKCSECLASHLDDDVIYDVISVADMVRHEALKEAAISYIKKNAAKVLGAPKWKEWLKKNPLLGSEILCKFSDIITAAS